MRRRLKTTKAKADYQIGVKWATLPLEDQTQITIEKSPRVYIALKITSPIKQIMQNENKSHGSLKNNSNIQYFHLFNIARSDTIPYFCQQPE